MTQIANPISSLSQSPLFFDVRGRLKAFGKTYEIRPFLREDREAIASFYQAFSDPFFKDPLLKKKCTQEEALRRTDDLIQRHLQENPWSGYLISSLDIKEIKGLWLLESVEPGVLLISALIREDKMEKKEMREGIKTQAWKWTVKALLPLVDDMNVKVIGKPLEESCLRIVIHEHYPAVKQGKFEDEGFICKSKDGLLRHYEYPVKQLFQRQLETIHECLVE